MWGGLGLFGVVRGGRGGRELAPLSDRVVFHADHDFDIHWAPFLLYLSIYIIYVYTVYYYFGFPD